MRCKECGTPIFQKPPTYAQELFRITMRFVLQSRIDYTIPHDCGIRKVNDEPRGPFYDIEIESERTIALEEELPVRPILRESVQIFKYRHPLMGEVIHLGHCKATNQIIVFGKEDSIFLVVRSTLQDIMSEVWQTGIVPSMLRGIR